MCIAVPQLVPRWRGANQTGYPPVTTIVNVVSHATLFGRLRHAIGLSADPGRRDPQVTLAVDFELIDDNVHVEVAFDFVRARARRAQIWVGRRVNALLRFAAIIAVRLCQFNVDRAVFQHDHPVLVTHDVTRF